MMTSRRGRTSQLHKQITQTNRTEQDDITSKNGNDEQCFQMLQSNSGAYGVPDVLGHDSTSDTGIALRKWVHFQGVHNILDLFSCDQEELNAVPAQQIISLDDHDQGLYLRTNQIIQMCGLITYMKHVFGAYNSDIDNNVEDIFNPAPT